MDINMRKLSLISFICLSLWCATASAQLVHHWQFDNPTPLWDEGLGAGIYGPHDAQLIDHIYTGYTIPTLVTGKFGNAYDLGTAGTSDILIGGDDAQNSAVEDNTYPRPPMTISLWFYPTVEPTTSAFNYLVGNYFNSNNQDRFYLGLTKASAAPNNNGVCFSIGAAKNQFVGATPTHSVPINNWHHAFMVCTPVTASGVTTMTVDVVVDGDYGASNANVLHVAGISQSASLPPWMFDKGNKRLGTNGNTRENNKTFMGKVDDFAVWNEALPLSQAGFVWNGGAGRRANVADGKRAYDPTPVDKTSASNVAQLKWYNASRLTATMTNDVYISTNIADLLTTGSNVPLFPTACKVATAVAGSANAQSTANVTLTGASDATTYYWRVATKTTNPADGNNVNGYAGPVWTFVNMANTAPVAEAGPDKYTYVGAGTTTISGTVTDDGHPTGVTVACTWKDATGTPITTNVVKTGNSYACTATVPVGALDSVTTYTLAGDDTTGVGTDTMSLRVKSTPCAAAQADPLYLKATGDINDDCFVNFKDFALTVSKWKVCTALDANCN